MGGFARIPNELFDFAPRIGPVGIAVMAALYRFAGGRRQCWPSLETIEATSGVSRRQVIRTIRTLELLGLISVDRSQGRTSNRYTLRLNSDCESLLEERNGDCQSPQQCHTVTVNGDCQSPEEEQEKKNRKKNTPLKGADETFQSFWKEYPVKVKKVDAQRAWDRLAPSATDFESIMAGLRRHMQSRAWKKDDGQYIPHPASFLNGRRWEDEISATNGTRHEVSFADRVAASRRDPA